MRGPVSIQVQLTDGRSVHRHLDQVRNYNAAAPVKDQCQAEIVPANSEDVWYDTVPFGDRSLQSGRQAIPPVVAAHTPPPEAYPEN